MKPLFTIHVGEYLVGEHIERKYPRWNVWLPSKDTGIDLLITDMHNRKAVSLQVKFSKDFNPTQKSLLIQNRLLSTGWWTHDPKKLQKSAADFWVFVLPSFIEKQISFIIVPPTELLRRFRAIHGIPSKKIQSYLSVTRNKRCWEVRGLKKADKELLAVDRFADKNRDFTMFLNAWKQIEKRLTRTS